MLTIRQNCLVAKYTRCCYGSVQYRVREITEHDAEIYIYLKSDNEMYAFCAHTVASTQEFQIRETTDVIKKLAHNALPQENARKLIWLIIGEESPRFVAALLMDSNFGESS